MFRRMPPMHVGHLCDASRASSPSSAPRRHRRRREKRSYLLPLSGEGVNDNGTVASACTIALVMESRVREATGDFVMECIFNYLGLGEREIQEKERAVQLTQ
jgi:hypothetical protein